MGLERGIEKINCIDFPNIKVTETLRLSELRGYNHLTGNFISRQEYGEYRERILSMRIP